MLFLEVPITPILSVSPIQNFLLSHVHLGTEAFSPSHPHILLSVSTTSPSNLVHVPAAVVVPSMLLPIAVLCSPSQIVPSSTAQLVLMAVLCIGQWVHHNQPRRLREFFSVKIQQVLPVRMSVSTNQRRPLRLIPPASHIIQTPQLFVVITIHQCIRRTG